MKDEHAEKLKAWSEFRDRLLKKRRLSRTESIRRERLKKRLAARRRLLRQTLVKAGLDLKPDVMSKWIFRTSIAINLIVAFFLIQRYHSFFQIDNFLFMLLFLVTAWLAVFLLVFFALWLAMYMSFDLLSYRRRVRIEDVLPDFLLLASANIRAGMPIDRALWYAVRPRFGVLAKEMEHVAKETMSGADLEFALRNFGEKYDSAVLKNTISLIIEGLRAGGEIGDLLHNISVGIQDNRILRKEMEAGVSAYAIFISVSAVIVAPIMFALSNQLLTVITGITSNIQVSSAGSSQLALISVGVGISHQDFLTFAYLNLFVTALLAAMTVSTIKKGGIRNGLRYIPAFIIISASLFYFANKILGGVFGSIVLG
ncbi:type II secretion system F family protein [Candidatus Woesearchaeota archaeon]|nr:type II secretion system F family protein [Candidatus Woesearchaeota archaeon]